MRVSQIRRRAPALPIRLALLLAALLWLLVPGVASAHAHLVRANPVPDSVVARAPAVATFVFDEPLNPTLTRVRVTDAAGRQVTPDTGRLARGHDAELWELPLPALRPGVYSVFWTSESATDGHVMGSFYTFRVAPSGGASGAGAVTGAASGVYGGRGGAPAGIAIGGGALATALFSWLGLMAEALWLGALIVELAVLGPARRATRTAEPRLAWTAAPRLWWLVRGAVVVAMAALAGEIVSLAVQGTGGDWGQALSPLTIEGIFSSQNGHQILARLALLVIVLLIVGPIRAPASSGVAGRFQEPEQHLPQALGITAPAVTVFSWQSARLPLAVLAAVYMLLVAFSGHAANVTPGWLSYAVDWAHLVCTGAWAGGIAALAFGVTPLRWTLPAEERAPALLSLLDRFSPVAYTAIGVLAFSGLYNAVNHLDSPSTLINTTYGQLLLLKVVLVGLLMLLSATHVYGLRPRLARPLRQSVPVSGARRAARPAGGNVVGHDADTVAQIHEGLATLAGRLRLETAVGMTILLATAFMGQTLPAHPTSPPAANTLGVVPTSIIGTATSGDLRGALMVAPPAVGTTTFTLRLWEKGTPLNGDSAAAIIHLYPVTQPALRANLTAPWQGTRFATRGSLAATGRWEAEVLVRTATVNAYRTLRFTFTVGPGAAFLAPGGHARAITVVITPGRIATPNTVTIGGLQAGTVRLLSRSLDMNMGVIPYPATALGAGAWRVTEVYPPMQGHWSVTVQARQHGAWISLQEYVYLVPLQGPIRLLSGGPRGAGTISHPAQTGVAFNVAFARRLPYVALVTEMGSDGVRLMSKPETLVHTGVQAHGVDVLDGTPYAYVTNFGAEPGTVSQIDLPTMRVIRTFTVGLGPAHIVFTPDHRLAFVTNFRSNDLSVISLAGGPVRRVAFPDDLCFEPHGADISTDGQTLYVACAGGAWIYTVDTRTLKPGRAIPTGPGAFGVAVDGPRHEVWVTNQTANNVVVLAEQRLRKVATIPVGQGPALMAISPDGRRVYIAEQSGNAVSVVDAATRRVTATIPVAAQPHGPDVTADGKYIYVASIGGNAVTIIRASDNRVVAVVPSRVGSNEVAIAH